MSAQRGEDPPDRSSRRVPQPRPRDVPERSTGLISGVVNELRPWMHPLGAVGLTAEWIFSSTHMAFYPLGLLLDYPEAAERYHLGDLAPHQRGLVVGDVEAAGTPILLVHGILDNRSVFAYMRHQLRRKGFGKVFAINYGPWTNDVRASARDLSAAVEELVARTGYERVHLIGHSLGGLIGRYYVQRLGGHARVHTLVTIGSPHSGTLIAKLTPFKLGRQLSPDGDLIRELAEPAPDCRTRMVSYYSDMDQMVLPTANGAIRHPDLTYSNIELHRVGHMSLVAHSTVVGQIGDLLSQLDSDGATVRPGVTPLPQSL